jgi:hypothetical protein
MKIKTSIGGNIPPLMVPRQHRHDISRRRGSAELHTIALFVYPGGLLKRETQWKFPGPGMTRPDDAVIRK